MKIVEELFTTVQSKVYAWLWKHTFHRHREVPRPNSVPAVEYQPPRSNTNQAPWDPQMNEMDAIRQTFQPAQSNSLNWKLHEFSPTGSIPIKTESFTFTPDGMQRIEERGATMLAGNEISSPKEIGAICQCGKAIRASKLRTCHFCGVSVCQQCGRYQPLPPDANLPVSVLIMCPTHSRKFRDEWQHHRGSKLVFLPPDMSIVVLDKPENCHGQ